VPNDEECYSKQDARLSQRLACSAGRLAVLSRFSLVGIFAAIVYTIVANLLILTGALSPSWASAAGFGAGAIVSFTGQRNYTFRSRADFLRQMPKFLILLIVGAIGCYSLVLTFTHGLGIHFTVATVMTALIYSAISFLVMSLWVFR
jgi:putative flippase GtrA